MQSMICNRLSFTRESTAAVSIHYIFANGAHDIQHSLVSSVSLLHPNKNGVGHYYSYVRPDVQSDTWYRFDDEFVTMVECTDVIADAYGGSNAAQRKRSSSDSFTSNDAHEVQQRRGLLRRILSLFGLFRRVQLIRSRAPDRHDGVGYGGRTSNAYMLQYVHRSDVPKLWCNI